MANADGMAALRHVPEARTCHLRNGLDPLRELPELAQLTLYAPPEDGPYDLAPLAGPDGLTITLGGETAATGTEFFPPGRIVRLGRGPSRAPAGDPRRT
ncbi:hypothetical protein [Streptomyces sp. NPDC014734]|uniref:hypothetical protein n=1 Tax=Streptomyces sp. NPDC014734 TaxID=3364886 RepID=UPI0037033CFF